MIARIQQLADALGLSQGGLLILAREVSQDGALLSIRLLRGNHQLQLVTELERIQTKRAEIRELTSSASGR